MSARAFMLPSLMLASRALIIFPTMRSFLRRALLMTAVATRSLGAQRVPIDTTSRCDSAVAPDSNGSTQPRVSARNHALHFDERLAAGLVLGSLVLMPLDRQAESWLERPSLQASPALHSTAVAFNWLGGTGVLAGSVGALAIGRLTGNDRLSEVGLHTTEAIVASGAIVGATKGIIGRQRPFLEKRDPGDFFPGHGFSNGSLASFPSGHTAAAFSAATVLSIEAHRSWPKAAPILSPLLYGGATAVGLARMYDSRHWASDVAFGATVGTLTGIQVMRYNDTHPDNRLSRWLVRTSITPNGSHGVTIGLSLPMPLVGIFPTR
jgi:membrane-associated phospholipid phosphatase